MIETGSSGSVAKKENTQIVNKEMAIPTITVNKEKSETENHEKRHIYNSVFNPEDVIESLKPWEQYIEKYSVEFGVDPDLIRAIIYTESRGDPYVISRVGALGLMQIMPNTAEIMEITNPLDPGENIKAGVKYVSLLFKSGNRNDETRMLWAYNAGPGEMIGKDIVNIPRETKKFISEVLNIKNFLKRNLG
jgi:soluble lytic murein transglycosylase-like protein